VLAAAQQQLPGLTRGITPTDPNVLRLIPTYTAANVHGYASAFWWGAGLFAVAAVFSLIFINAGKADVSQGETAAAV